MQSWSRMFISQYRSVVTWPSLLRWWFFSIHEKKNSRHFQKLISIRLAQPYSRMIRFRPVSNDLYTFDEIFVHRVYQEVVARLGSVSYMLDAGANIGFASIFINALCGPLKQCVCIEPYSENVKLLRYNLKDFVANNIGHIYEGALWGHDGTVVLNALEKGHVNQLCCSPVSDISSENSVRAYSVTSLIKHAQMPRIDLLKMDIEGGEIHVFAGDVSWLKNVRMLAIEFHGDSRQQSGFDDIMKKYHFSVTAESFHTVIAFRH